MTGFSIVTVTQWIKHWSSGHRVVQAEGLSPGRDIYNFFSAMILFQFCYAQWTSVTK